MVSDYIPRTIPRYGSMHAGDRTGTTLFRAYPRLSIAIISSFLRLLSYKNSRYLLQKHIFFIAYLFYFYALLPICIAVGVATRGMQTVVSFLSPTWYVRFVLWTVYSFLSDLSYKL